MWAEASDSETQNTATPIRRIVTVERRVSREALPKIGMLKSPIAAGNIGSGLGSKLIERTPTQVGISQGSCVERVEEDTTAAAAAAAAPPLLPRVDFSHLSPLARERETTADEAVLSINRFAYQDPSIHAGRSAERMTSMRRADSVAPASHSETLQAAGKCCCTPRRKSSVPRAPRRHRSTKRRARSSPVQRSRPDVLFREPNSPTMFGYDSEMRLCHVLEKCKFKEMKPSGASTGYIRWVTRNDQRLYCPYKAIVFRCATLCLPWMDESFKSCNIDTFGSQDAVLTLLHLSRKFNRAVHRRDVDKVLALEETIKQILRTDSKHQERNSTVEQRANLTLPTIPDDAIEAHQHPLASEHPVLFGAAPETASPIVSTRIVRVFVEQNADEFFTARPVVNRIAETMLSRDGLQRLGNVIGQHPPETCDIDFKAMFEAQAKHYKDVRYRMLHAKHRPQNGAMVNPGHRPMAWLSLRRVIA